MSKITCQSCGARQPGERKACISCGRELLPEAPIAPAPEPMTKFIHSRFTLIVTVISIISTLALIGLVISVIAAGELELLDLLAAAALLSSVAALIICLFPEYSYKSPFSPANRNYSLLYRLDHPEQFENPTLEAVRAVYVDAVFYIAIAWIIAAIRLAVN